MATKDEKGSDLLICPVCGQEYKIPKLISCGHSVCMKPCLQNLLQRSSPMCLVCSSEIQTTSSASADSFPTNPVLEALLNRRGDFKATPSSSNTNITVKRKLCQLHEENLDKFCETCSEMICEKCANEIHDQLHEVTSVREAANKFFDRLEGTEQTVKTAHDRLCKILDTLEKAKLKCETDSDHIKVQISESGILATQLLQNCVEELSSKVDERKEKILKKIRTIKSQQFETLLFSNYLKTVCGELKDNHQGYSFSSKGVVNNLSSKTEKLSQDVLHLENTNVPDGIGLYFHPSPLQHFHENSLGTLEPNPLQTKLVPIANKLWDITIVGTYSYHPGVQSYKGFVWVNKSTNIHVSDFVIKHVITIQGGVGGNASFLTTANISVISPCTDKSGLSVLGHNETSIYKLSYDLSSTITATDEKNLECATENAISAVCWDESRNDCYALLKDGKTIIRINMGVLVRQNFEIKLDEPVTSVTSRQFHVSKLGGMAICEIEKKRVQYYERVQSKATKTVTAPPDIKGWYPVFVITREDDQRWFVAWETRSYDIEDEGGVPYARIYQYDETFELEGLCFKLACSKIKAFSFTNRYFSCDSSYNSSHHSRRFSYGRRRPLIFHGEDSINKMGIVIEDICYNSQKTCLTFLCCNGD